METKQKILLIDDEKDLRSALRTALEDAGFVVLEASNGIDGLTLAQSQLPNLILLDINMPHMGGHQVLHELRLHKLANDPHILLLTNNDDATNISRGVTQKSDDYIIKSQTSLTEIVKRVKQHLAGYYDRT